MRGVRACVCVCVCVCARARWGGGGGGRGARVNARGVRPVFGLVCFCQACLP